LAVASEFLAVDRNGLIDGGMMGDGKWKEGRKFVECRPMDFRDDRSGNIPTEHFTTGLDPDECGSGGKRVLNDRQQWTWHPARALGLEN
jgi:hypothetical protein